MRLKPRWPVLVGETGVHQYVPPIDLRERNGISKVGDPTRCGEHDRGLHALGVARLAHEPADPLGIAAFTEVAFDAASQSRGHFHRPIVPASDRPERQIGAAGSKAMRGPA